MLIPFLQSWGQSDSGSTEILWRLHFAHTKRIGSWSGFSHKNGSDGMSLQLQTLSFDAYNPLHLAGFWASALGWKLHHRHSGDVGLIPTDGTRFSIVFRPSTCEMKQKQDKNRLHIDLTTKSIDDQTESVQKLIALGARHIDIGQSPDEPHVVLADPEGNEFCIVEPGNSFLAGCNRLGSITCDGSQEVGHFWSKALGWPLVWDQNEETAIRAPQVTGPFITWGPPVHPNVTRNRLNLELVSRSEDALPSEVDRLVSLGATHANPDKSDGQKIAMFDPDGNEFYVQRPRCSSTIGIRASWPL